MADKTGASYILALLDENSRCPHTEDGVLHYGDSGPYCAGCKSRRYEIEEKVRPILYAVEGLPERLRVEAQEWEARGTETAQARAAAMRVCASKLSAALSQKEEGHDE